MNSARPLNRYSISPRYTGRSGELLILDYLVHERHAGETRYLGHFNSLDKAHAFIKARRDQMAVEP